MKSVSWKKRKYLRSVKKFLNNLEKAGYKISHSGDRIIGRGDRIIGLYKGDECFVLGYGCHYVASGNIEYFRMANLLRKEFRRLFPAVDDYYFFEPILKYLNKMHSYDPIIKSS